MFSAKIREKSVGKMKQMRLLAVLLVPVVAFIMGGAVSKGWAHDCWWNIEFNATDGDVGVRGFFDDDPWKELEIENPRGRTFIEVEAENRKMRRQGLAEWFFESGEPPLTEVSFETFLRRFPAGPYTFEAETNNPSEVECVEELTHVIPCAPDIDVKQDEKSGVISITWDSVETVVYTRETDRAVADAEPDEWDAELFLVCGGPAPDIVGYEVIVETEVDGEEKEYKIDLPGDATSVSVPLEFIELSDEFDYEVLAIEESGNQTISEDEFCVDEESGEVVECNGD